jgi:NAD(P)-dependent dehydrogenase (short-subunit alcohol dehydrogenase family)
MSNAPSPIPSLISDAAVEAAIQLLDTLTDDRVRLAEIREDLRLQLMIAAGRLSRPGRDAVAQTGKEHRKARKRAALQQDRALIESSGLRQQRQAPVYTPLWLEPPSQAAEAHTHGDASDAVEPEPGTPEPGTPEPSLNRPRACYVCKAPYAQVHFYYDSMCGRCGDFCYAKRRQTADLRGRVALVTGGRLKIGYQCALTLLRAGARVIVTTRFPHDAAHRFGLEADFSTFSARLQIYGLDFRHAPSVEAFCLHLCETEQQLDLLINNACQTIRRPPEFYAHLIEAERIDPALLPAAERAVLGSEPPLSRPPPSLSQSGHLDDASIVPEAIFPKGRLDEDLQQVDLRTMNSWRLKLADVSTPELLEVHLVNAIAPFILNSKLKPLLLRGNTGDRHIVNVSAMEGQFYRVTKSDKHPHTNMAKAALNMMTRTSAPDYRKDGIFMNAVDTGWVTDEDPAIHVERKVADGFQPPLDIIDGAARILDPFLTGINTGVQVWGQFIKDYKPSPW